MALETAQNIITNSSASAVTLTLSGSGAYSYGAGTIAKSGIIAGAINLVVNGSGTNALGDINTYTGTTKVNAGTLALTGVGVIGGHSRDHCGRRREPGCFCPH